MHDKDYESLLKSMTTFQAELKKGGKKAKKLAHDFLVSAGIITEKGNLRYPYRGLDGYKVTNRKNAKLKENRK